MSVYFVKRGNILMTTVLMRGNMMKFPIVKFVGKENIENQMINCHAKAALQERTTVTPMLLETPNTMMLQQIVLYAHLVNTNTKPNKMHV